MFNKKMIISLWLVCLILASIVLAAPRLSSPDNPMVRYINQSIDNKIDVTLELSSGAAAASLAVSALPGDTATPISDELAEFGSGFLLVLCVLYFEKSMFSVIVFILFFLGIPLVLASILAYQRWADRRLLRLAAFAMIVSLFIGLVIPVSQFLSDIVYVSQQSIVQDTIQSSEDLSLEIVEGKEETVESGDEEQEDGSRRYILPDAAAVIDPKREDCAYPCRHLCGASVAWKLVTALYDRFGAGFGEAMEFIQYAAAATVTDVCELKGENRMIVREGLKMLQNTGNTGLSALIDITGIDRSRLDVYHIGFILGPCINASGRLKDADLSLKLLLAEEKD